jgi:hypothetical protein
MYFSKYYKTMNYNNNKNGVEERVFSVTMTEEELSLFSEFLDQREFARRNYNGLDSATRRNLLKARNNQARELKSARRVSIRTTGGVSYHDDLLRISKAKANRLDERARFTSGLHAGLNDNVKKGDLKRPVGYLYKKIGNYLAWKSPGRDFLTI